jgi:hypothetical protein
VGGRALASPVEAAKRVQAGSKLVVLGVTDDDRAFYALYRDEGSVSATALWPGAPRRFVASASQPPLTMVAGRVAMVLAAAPYVGAPAPSPLVVWTAKHGAWAASDAAVTPALGAPAIEPRLVRTPARVRRGSLGSTWRPGWRTFRRC